MNPVTPANRIPLMANGTIDLECGSATNNAERQKQVAFAPTMFVVANKLLVKKSSGIKSLADLSGKKLGAPVFDAGRRRANVDAAQARYELAVSQYRGSVRKAVAELEQAMVTLNSTGERASDAEISLQGYRVAFTATEDRYKNGLASLLELEDARRSRLAAENTVVNLQQERSNAWVALYRAAGGGWTAPTMNKYALKPLALLLLA
eukprot:gene34658-57474_t